MKKILCILLISGIYSLSYGQGSGGLIAHWNMNGSTNDVSGNGNNGIGYNITPAVGMDGVMGDGYYFNGVNSMIVVPYSPSFNVSTFSICATLNIMGFYLGDCQENMVVGRGSGGPYGVGNYYMMFNDKAGDNYGCTEYDTTVEVFQGSAGDLHPPVEAYQYYTPAIIESQWYNVVITFDDTAYRTYINGTLKNISYITTPGVAIGSSTDPIYIGFDIHDSASGFSYPFNGIIDDIRLYDTVLSDSEINTFSDTTINYDTATAVTVITNVPAVSIFPNPAHNELNIQYAASTSLSIYNVLGQEIYTAKIMRNLQSINVADLITGVYIMEFTALDGSKKTIRLLKD